MMFPLSIKAYNVAAQVAAYEAFNKLTTDSTYLNSAVLFEAYGTAAVKDVPSDSTAFPYRADNILMYVVFTLVAAHRANSRQELPSSAMSSTQLWMPVPLLGAKLSVKSYTRLMEVLRSTPMSTTLMETRH